MGQKGSFQEKFMLAADIFFVLILCFLILFSTLIVTKFIVLNDYTVNGYHISAPLFLAVAASIGAYLCFMLSASMKNYRELEEAYRNGKEENNGSDA